MLRRAQTDTDYLLVPMGRIELPTSPLPRECSTTEPHGRFYASNFHGLERVKGIEPSS